MTNNVDSHNYQKKVLVFKLFNQIDQAMKQEEPLFSLLQVYSAHIIAYRIQVFQTMIDA